MGYNSPQENNNNQDEQKTDTQKPSSWRNITRTPSQQLLLHRVPITFPVPGNLLESEDSLGFIIEALGSLVESDGFLINLPMGAIVDATPLHRVTSYQARSAVILTFDTTDTRDDSTSEKLRLMREGSVDDLPTLVRDISTMVPVSNIDKTQARHQGGQNFFESTRLDDENAVEACLREETRLVEEVERIRDRENSECDLRETMRKRTGPSDLRQTNLNRDTDAPHRPELLE